MTERKTLKSVFIDDVKLRVTLTPVVEVSSDACKIHHIKADSIAVDGRDTFVPLRHVSKQSRRIFELEDENAKLRELAKDACTVLRGFFDPEWFDETVFAERMRELGIEVK